jgi:hypothetical protein
MLRLYLGYARYRVMAANTCGECLQLARIERVDLYLLGDGCEDGDAFELCRKIRALDSSTPIIIQLQTFLLIPTIILSNLVQYWTAMYSDLTEDDDIPFAAARIIRTMAAHRRTSKASEMGYEC